MEMSMSKDRRSKEETETFNAYVPSHENVTLLAEEAGKDGRIGMDGSV